MAVDNQIQQGFTSIYEGKEKIVTALQAKGQTSASIQDTFPTLANKIKKIDGGGGVVAPTPIFLIESLYNNNGSTWKINSKNEFITDVTNYSGPPESYDDDPSYNNARAIHANIALNIDTGNATYVDKPSFILKVKANSLDHIVTCGFYQNPYSSNFIEFKNYITPSQEYIELDLSDIIFPDTANNVCNAWSGYITYWTSSSLADEDKLTFSEYCISNHYNSIWGWGNQGSTGAASLYLFLQFSSIAKMRENPVSFSGASFIQRN